MTASDPAWQPASGRLPHCGQEHGGRPGSFDESARRVSHYELAAADLLVAEGHTVRSRPERRGMGPAPDFDVCGLPVEVKTLVPQAERPGGRPANDRSAYNRLLSGIDQAPITILLAQGSGLRPADAAAGMQRFAARPRAGQTTAVRIVGDGWDLAWKAQVGVERTGRRPADRPPPDQDRPRPTRDQGGGRPPPDRGRPPPDRGRPRPTRGQGNGRPPPHRDQGIDPL